MKKISYEYVKKIELYLRSSFPFGFVRKSNIYFFPGCSLSSSNPLLVNDVFDFLKRKIPAIELWSACCGRPLSQFISKESAEGFQNYLLKKIDKNIEVTIITACGNCFAEFKSFGTKNKKLKVISLYEILAEEEWDPDLESKFKIHHPCPARSDKEFHESFAKLIDKCDIIYDKFSMENHSLSCCLVESDSAQKKIKNNINNKFITYCAHCVRTFQNSFETKHILQLIFNDKRLWKKQGLFRQLFNLLKLKRGR